MKKGFSDKVKKIVGRRACRHYANLLLECCHSAAQAALVSTRGSGKASLRKRPSEQGIKEEFKRPQTEKIAGKQVRAFENSSTERKSSTEQTAPEGCVVDLHVHSLPASPCSSATVDELIEEAKRIGLHAFCLTDHNYTWSKADVDRLMESHEYLILRGNEITTDQGDMLVFGLDKEVNGIVKLEELSQEVKKAGGFIIVAHPFRGFLTFGIGQLGLTPQEAMQRPLFNWIDAIEVLNGKVTKKENAFALEVAQGLGKPITGGSDAHEVSEIGIYATKFEGVIRDEKDLIEALHDGGFSPIAFRAERGIK